ncbi:hypothetical protein HanIR_Chr15g0744831 [Helianthus annuus]|nr:hypothetical protein HanIR_Chr15g0744831 [Helianthus annuus]
MVHTIVLHCKYMMDKGRNFVLHSTHMRWVVHAMVPRNKCMKVVAHNLTLQSTSTKAHTLVHQNTSMREEVHTFGLHRMCMKLMARTWAPHNGCKKWMVETSYNIVPSAGYHN